MDSCLSILDKLEIDKSKLYLGCQDWEYTLADDKYLKEYIELYRAEETTDLEKRVLGCFIIQSITDLLPTNITKQEVRKSLAMLARDFEIHKEELEYWSNFEEDNEENWFYVTRYIREINT